MIPKTPDFTKLVPGFDFLQGLVKNAGSVLPGVGQWVAPTLDPAELEKRIDELRTVQFWLEQNARMLGATIQALEVQRMTLSTLQTMNVQVADLRESMKIKLPEVAKEAAKEAAQPPAEATAPESDDAKASTGQPGTPAGVVDPTQWWGALTKQFTELAANAMKDAAAESARQMPGGLRKPMTDAAASRAKPAAAARKAPAKRAARKSTVSRSPAKR